MPQIAQEYSSREARNGTRRSIVTSRRRERVCRPHVIGSVRLAQPVELAGANVGNGDATCRARNVDRRSDWFPIDRRGQAASALQDITVANRLPAYTDPAIGQADDLQNGPRLVFDRDREGATTHMTADIPSLASHGRGPDREEASGRPRARDG